MKANQYKANEIPFRKSTEIIVTFENGTEEHGTIEFIPDFYGPNAYYYDEDNHDGWLIKYSNWFVDNEGTMNERSELGEFHEIEGGWEAEDGNYGRITFKLA